MNFEKRIEAQARRLRHLGIETKRSAIYREARMSAAVRRAWADDPAALVALNLGALSVLMAARRCAADAPRIAALRVQTRQGGKS